MKKVKLNRSVAHRASLGKNLVRSLFLEEGITTTEAKAKMVRSLAEHLVTVAKKADLASLRRLISETGSKDLAKKIIEVAGKLKARNSGYLRLTKVGIRVGDKAVMTKVEFVFDEVKKVAKKAAAKKEKVTPVEAVEVKAEEAKEVKE